MLAGEHSVAMGRCESLNRGQVYGWVEGVLAQQEYAQQGNAARCLGDDFIAYIDNRKRSLLPEPTAVRPKERR